MINFICKIIAKKYTPCLELHNVLNSYISIHHPSHNSIEGYNEFFHLNNFLIATDIFESYLEQEIYKELSEIYDFESNQDNIKIIKGKKKIYFDNRFVNLNSGDIFVYDKSKLKVYF